MKINSFSATIFLLFTVMILASACSTGKAVNNKDGGAGLQEANTIQEQVPQQAAGISNGAEGTVLQADIEQLLEEAYEDIHSRGSAEHIRKNFDDLQLVYTDNEVPPMAPEQIFPFRYYYSEKADTTFNICNVDISVFICDGKLDRRITKEDVESGKCEVAEEYKPILGIKPTTPSMMPFTGENSEGTPPGQNMNGKPLAPPPGMTQEQMMEMMSKNPDMMKKMMEMMNSMPQGFGQNNPNMMPPGMTPPPGMMQQGIMPPKEMDSEYPNGYPDMGGDEHGGGYGGSEEQYGDDNNYGGDH